MFSVSFHLVHSKHHLVLRDQRVLGLSQDPDKHVLVERVEGNKGRESTDKLGNHSKVDEVAGLHGGQVAIPLGLVLLLVG